LTPWTTLTGAGALVVDDGRMLLVGDREPFHLHVGVSVNPDGTQSYPVRP
jgi:hypothetical protein